MYRPGDVVRLVRFEVDYWDNDLRPEERNEDLLGRQLRVEEVELSGYSGRWIVLGRGLAPPGHPRYIAPPRDPQWVLGFEEVEPGDPEEYHYQCMLDDLSR
jgi:hypothetical protein